MSKDENGNSGLPDSYADIENFIDREVEAMDESGQWSTHAINALLCLQSRIDAKLRELVGQ